MTTPGTRAATAARAMAIRWSPQVASRAGRNRSGPGPATTSPSGSSVTATPSLPSSATRAASRSVSWPRATATPRMRDRPAASAARAAGGDLVGQGGQVGVDRAEGLGAAHGQAGAVAGHAGAHRLQEQRQSGVGLEGGGVGVGHRHRPAGGRGQGEQVGGGAGVVLDLEVGRPVGPARLDPPGGHSAMAGPGPGPAGPDGRPRRRSGA